MTAKQILVRVSTLALLSAPYAIGSARAQNLVLTCKQNIDIGNLIPTGCSGKYIISPDNNHQDLGGCLVFNNDSAKAGNCSLKVTGGAPTKSATIRFDKIKFTINGSKGGSASITALRMKLRTDTPIASRLTIGSATLATKTPLLIDIGGSLGYTQNQPAGSYSGKVAVTADFN